MFKIERRTAETKREMTKARFIAAHEAVVSYVDKAALEAWIHIVSHKLPRNPPKQPAWWYGFLSGYLNMCPHVIPLNDLEAHRQLGKPLVSQLIRDSNAYGSSHGWKIGSIKPKMIPTTTAVKVHRQIVNM